MCETEFVELKYKLDEIHQNPGPFARDETLATVKLSVDESAESFDCDQTLTTMKLSVDEEAQPLDCDRTLRAQHLRPLKASLLFDCDRTLTTMKLSVDEEAQPLDCDRTLTTTKLSMAVAVNPFITQKTSNNEAFSGRGG